LIDSKLRTHALKLINTHLSSFKNQYGFSYRNVSVRNQSSRFGSCSHVNNLNFNWQIIFFPLAQFQHILLHELTHTIVKDHSSRFWSQLAVYDPMWRSHRQWLKKEGSLQFLI
jgi:predicted metal-dependent hydrolase